MKLKPNLLSVVDVAYTDHNLYDHSGNKWHDYMQHKLTATEWGGTATSFSPSNAFWCTNFIAGDAPPYMPVGSTNNLGSGALTIEFWVRKVTNSSNVRYLMSFGTATLGWSIRLSATDQLIFKSNATDLITSAADILPADKWCHVAVVRSGLFSTSGNVKMYVDGVLVGTSSAVSHDYTSATGNFVFGGDYTATAGAGYTFTGDMTDVRLSKEAVYSAAFSVPTAPLTSGANTILLLPTTSNKVSVFTANANRRISRSPFADTDTTGGSMYLWGDVNHGLRLSDRSDNDTLRLGTGNFTIEFWMFHNLGVGRSSALVWKGTDASNMWTVGVSYDTLGNISITFIDNATKNTTANIANITAFTQWTHVAIVRSGTGTNQCAIYVDGKNLKTFTCSTNYNTNSTLGVAGGGFPGGVTGWSNAVFTGLVADLHITKTAKYSADFTPANSIVKDSGTALLIYKGRKPIVQTLMDGAHDWYPTREWFHRPLFSEFGNSALFEGLASYIMGNNVVQFAPGTTDFSIECFINFRHMYRDERQIIFDARSAAADIAPTLRCNGNMSIELSVGNKALCSSTTRVYPGEWYHVVVQKCNGYFALYLDGKLEGQAQFTTAIVAKDLLIGGSSLYATSGFYGWINNFRYIQGRAIYSNDPHNHKVIFEQPWESTTDNKGNAFTLVGNAQLSKLRKHSGSTSLLLDGTGDYATTPQTTLTDLGRSDFTIECWIYQTKQSGTRGIIEKRASSATYTPFALIVQDGVAQVSLSSTGTAYNIASWTSFGAVPLEKWTHIALTRTGDKFYGFVNGIRTEVATSQLALWVNSAITVVGGATDGGYFEGSIDELRITKGVARYTANFVPGICVNYNTLTVPVPTKDLEPVWGTKILVCNRNPVIQDQSGTNTTTMLTGKRAAGFFNYAMVPFGPFPVRHKDDCLDGYGYTYADYTKATEICNNTDWSILSSLQQPYTLEVWFHAAHVDPAGFTGATILRNTVTADGTGLGFELVQNSVGTDAVNRINVRINGTSFPSAVTGFTAPLANGGWNHVAVVFDPRYTTNKLSVYINGIRCTLGNPTATKRTTDLGYVADSMTFGGAGIGFVHLRRGNAMYQHIGSGQAWPTFPYKAEAPVRDSNTLALLKLVASTNTDSSALPIIMHKNVVPTDSVKKYGNGSFHLQQNVSGMTVPSNIILGWDTGAPTLWGISSSYLFDWQDFTVETWASWGNGTIPSNRACLVVGTDTIRGYGIRVNSTGKWCMCRFDNGTDTDLITTTVQAAMAPNFDHIVFMRKSGNFVLYVNGKHLGTYEFDVAWEGGNRGGAFYTDGVVRIGCDRKAVLATAWDGYVQGIRAARGCLYKTEIIGTEAVMCEALDDGTPVPALPKLAQGITRDHNTVAKYVESTVIPYTTEYADDPLKDNVVCFVKATGNKIADTTGRNQVFGQGGVFGPSIATSEYDTDVAGTMYFKGGLWCGLSMPDSNDFNFSASNDVTLELWLKWDGTIPVTGITLFGQNSGTSANMRVAITDTAGTTRFYTRSDTQMSNPATQMMPINTWVHVALVKAGSIYTLYFNGVSVQTYTDATALSDYAYGYWLGQDDESAWPLRGYITDFRITKNAVRYSGPFTPPARTGA